MKIITPTEGETFDIELEENLLAKNRELAEANRRRLDERGIKAFDVMGAIGSGKTSLIGGLIEHLGSRPSTPLGASPSGSERATPSSPKGRRVGVLAGDLTTTIDADRLAQRGAAAVIQINTGRECHLDANLVARGLEELLRHDVEIIFIENVGNLICPAEFPLGSHARVVVVSVTEGPYMMRKHPYILREASVVVINKVDLAQVMNVDLEQLRRDALAVNPALQIIATDCLSGEGIDQVAAALGL